MRYQAALRPDRSNGFEPKISAVKKPSLSDNGGLYGEAQLNARLETMLSLRYPLRGLWRHDNGPPLE
jgi:hypothetical protein